MEYKLEKLNEYQLKLIVLGYKGVGKSSLLLKFCENIFQNNYIPTTNCEFFTNKIKLEKNLFKLQIWDIAGQNSEKLYISDTYFMSCFGIIIMYNICDYSSFENLQKWYDQIKEIKTFDINTSIIIVGNKSDINKREVSREEGIKLAEYCNNALFMEISSKTIKEIELVFYTLISNIYNKMTKNILYKKTDYFEVDDNCCKRCC